MNMSLVVGNLILIIHVHIVMDLTFGKIVDVLSIERYVHHLHPTGSMIVIYVAVEIEIRVITQMLPPPFLLT